MGKCIIKIVLFMVCFAVLLSAVTIVLLPKPEPEVATLSNQNLGFYREPENSLDVIFVGSSHVFCSVSPLELYNDYGITSYIRGSSCQRIWQSYYMLEDTFKRQSPEVVALEIMSLFDGTPQGEAFNREAFDFMLPNEAKLHAAMDAVERNEEESLASYAIPVMRYHDRWKSLTQADFDFFGVDKQMITKGYAARVGINPVTAYDIQNDSFEVEPRPIPETSLEYVKKIQELCDENGAELILFKAPTRYQYFWGGSSSLATSAMAQELGIPFYDLNYGEYYVNIKPDIDILDGGNHLNYTGAVKTTKALGEILNANYDFADKREMDEYNAWDEAFETYRAELDTAYMNYLGVDTETALQSSCTFIYEAANLRSTGGSINESNEVVLTSGAVQFGPYAQFERGSYNVRVTGRGLSAGVFDVLTETGFIDIGELSITDTECIYSFTLNQTCYATEFRCTNMGTAELYISSIEVTVQ